LPADWETYLNETVSQNTRKKVRRYFRQIEESNEFRITHTDAGTIERDLNTLLSFWQTKWEPKKGERLTRIMLANYRNMLTACFGAGSLFVPVLWQGDKALAVEAMFIDAKSRTLLSLVGGRDLTFDKPPPSFVLHMYSIRWAIENGFKVFDFLRGNEPYKYSFGSQDCRIECMRVRTNTRRNLSGRLEPRSLPLAVELAEERFLAGQFAEAERACRQILDTQPEHTGAQAVLDRISVARRPASEVLFDKAFELHQRGAWTEAEQGYRDVLQREPRHFNAAHLLGVVLLQRKQFAAAEQQLALAVEINPDIAAAHNNRGNGLRNLGRFEEALASYDRAIALKPNYAEAYNNRGNALRGLKRFAEALASYDNAIALRPDYPEAIGNRSHLLKDMSRSQEPTLSGDPVKMR
jgi:tetratricopeptide (TPR) repeat protein